jgi:hypothetical protein
MQDVTAGLRHIEDSPEWLVALSDNVKHIYKKIARMKGKKDEPRIRLEWPSALTGGDGTTVADAELLQLRRDVA